MNSWIDDLCRLREAGTDCVLVTVAAVRGSAPREAGAKMIVTSAETIGTIGGGQLEYRCARIGFGMLGKGGGGAMFRRFPLGADLGQCCGGVVDIMFEKIDEESRRWLAELGRLYREREPVVIVTGDSEKRLVTARESWPAEAQGDEAILTARAMIRSRRTFERIGGRTFEPVSCSDFNIAVFGAGHVGAAVVGVLASLHCNVRWVDGRRNVFPAEVPQNVQRIESANPRLEVAAMPAGSCYLVLTHSHPLDYEICADVLRRDDAAWCGLIGSRPKRRRFEKLMRQQGMSRERLSRLTCPIGVDGIAGKTPSEIAIAVSAQLLQVRDRETGQAQAGGTLRAI